MKKLILSILMVSACMLMASFSYALDYTDLWLVKDGKVVLPTGTPDSRTYYDSGNVRMDRYGPLRGGTYYEYNDEKFYPSGTGRVKLIILAGGSPSSSKNIQISYYGNTDQVYQATLSYYAGVIKSVWTYNRNGTVQNYTYSVANFIGQKIDFSYKYYGKSNIIKTVTANSVSYYISEGCVNTKEKNIKTYKRNGELSKEESFKEAYALVNNASALQTKTHSIDNYIGTSRLNRTTVEEYDPATQRLIKKTFTITLYRADGTSRVLYESEIVYENKAKNAALKEKPKYTFTGEMATVSKGYQGIKK